MKEQMNTKKAVEAKVAELKKSGMSDSDIVSWFLKQPDWFDYSGAASYQAAHVMGNGALLRVGVTDEDVAEEQGIWVDIFAGLHLLTEDGGCSAYNGKCPDHERT